VEDEDENLKISAHSFFKYPEKERPWSSRQTHNQMVNLFMMLNPTTGKLSHRQLVMLYTSYMGIEDVKSKLSRKIEATLVQELMCSVEYVHSLAVYPRSRISAKKKAADPTALWLGTKLKDKLVSQFTESDERPRALVEIYPGIVDKQITVLTLLMQCVDQIDTNFILYRSAEERRQIAGIMSLAFTVYEHLLSLPVAGAVVELAMFIGENVITREAEDIIATHIVGRPAKSLGSGPP
jgi:hypothetical protein